MQLMFPCPNPICTHTFSPETVQGASSLVCPKCGTVFQFTAGGKSPPPPRPAPPPASLPPPIAAVPIARPVANENLPAASTPISPILGKVGEGATLDFDSTSEAVAPRLRRKRSKPPSVAWMAAAVIAGILTPALAAWGGWWLWYFLKRANVEDDARELVASAYNSTFRWPGKPWTRDKDMQMRFHVHIGMRSSKDNNGMALLFKDYKNRLPSDAEMLDEALGKLRAYFRGLEWELKPKDPQARLAERPARVLQFQGEDTEQVTMNGQCYMMAYRGYGYWFFTWAPLSAMENHPDAVRAEWAQLRQRLQLLDGRKGWKEKPRETEPIAGKKAKYYLDYVKGLWTPEASEDEDPQIDLLLRGHEPDPERKPLAGKDATVQVLVLPPQADLASAAKAALAYIKQRETKLYERTAWEPIKDKNGAVDRETKIGAASGRLSKLHVKSTEELERYLAIAVVNRPEGVVVLLGDCLWERHDFWDQELMVLFNTFRTK